MLAPDDEEALALAYDAEMACGEAALAAEQWSVAASSFEKAADLSVDRSRAAEALARVETERERVAQQRRAAVEAVLEQARGGYLAAQPGGFEDGGIGLMLGRGVEMEA